MFNLINCLIKFCFPPIDDYSFLPQFFSFSGYRSAAYRKITQRKCYPLSSFEESSTQNLLLSPSRLVERYRNFPRTDHRYWCSHYRDTITRCPLNRVVSIHPFHRVQTCRLESRSFARYHPSNYPMHICIHTCTRVILFSFNNWQRVEKENN